MNENYPVIPPIEAAPVPAYKDRSTGLMIFGILTLLLGCLLGLFVPLMLFGQMMAAKAPNTPPTNTSVILMAVVIYGGLAVALIWLGIGSIKKRRWARALLLIFSWSWLVTGIVITVVVPFVMAEMFAIIQTDPTPGQTVPPAVFTGMIVFTVLFYGVFFVAMPAVWTFFYNSRHVKATCEARDPVPRWSDACPLPVLGFCLWLLSAVLMMLVMPLTGMAVMPFFGMFLSGLPGDLFCLLAAAVWGYAAWWLYHLDVRGWWLILIATVLFMVSALLTFPHHNIIEMYQLQGLPQAYIDQIQKIMISIKFMNWFMVLCWLPFLGYLLFIKKYLHKV